MEKMSDSVLNVTKFMQLYVVDIHESELMLKYIKSIKIHQIHSVALKHISWPLIFFVTLFCLLKYNIISDHAFQNSWNSLKFPVCSQQQFDSLLQSRIMCQALYPLCFTSPTHPPTKPAIQLSCGLPCQGMNRQHKRGQWQHNCPLWPLQKIAPIYFWQPD